MRPKAGPGPDRRRTLVDWLALTLLVIAADQDVRALEALAATLVRQARRTRRGLLRVLSALSPAPFPGAASIGDFSRKLQLCRRIARRALHGGLLDPAPGATVFHRIGESPAWARDLLPATIIGSFLFYDLADPTPTTDVQTGRQTTASGS